MARPKSENRAETGTLSAISNDAVYPQHVFLRMAGLGKHAFAVLRRNGLPTARLGNRVYVRGADFNEFVAKHAAPGIGQ